MAKTLIIVESPTKAKTIGAYLGPGYAVKASLGHVRDLPKSQLGIDTETFEPHYVTSGRPQALKDLRAAASSAESILLATDPDREGEAIAWHISQVLHIPDPKRLEFHEVTKSAIQEALNHPQPLNAHLIEAQQARRVLDRLVGYTLSPLLWRKVQRGISAGRVQSVALRLVCEREREIRSFQPEEFWTLDVLLQRIESDETFSARLVQIDGAKPEIHALEQAQALVERLQRSTFAVSSIKKNVIRRRPAPPFTTSTLQQAASNRLGMSTKRTMSTAQELYEGVALGDEGQQGLITYMRTDSVNLAESAIQEARSYLKRHFDGKYVPDKPQRYVTKTRGAQEAHEAIRPTSVHRTPDTVRRHLSDDQFRLYELIWQRFAASQMTPAEYARTTVEVDATEGQQRHATLRASATQLTFPGYLAVYGVNAEEQAADHNAEAEERSNSKLPDLREGETLNLVECVPEQHFTEPPPRYNEASLVRRLEEEGIGRPSTYAQILSTIQERGYTERQGRALVPTPLGFATNDFLVDHFDSIVDTHFTAQMEEQLDDIASGERNWKELLREFYSPFSSRVADKQNVPHVRVEKPPAVEIGEQCPQCGRPLVERKSRFGTFVGCSGYPECRYIKKPERPTAPVEQTDVTCPQCGKGKLVQRTATRGRNQGNTFYGCSTYPRCRYTTASLDSVQDREVSHEEPKGAAQPEQSPETPAKKTRPKRSTRRVTALATAPTTPGKVTEERQSLRPRTGARAR
ncbi:MAG: type I DNA topoisomerase [Chloroflexi bacterium]|nr:type I DNA topoisomerase [Chloroflexota bacterium]